MSEPRFTIEHIRATPKTCHSGARDWFAARGWNWSKFLDEGLPLSLLENENCTLGNRVAETARRMLNNGC